MDYDEAIEYLLSLTDMERGYQASPNPAMHVSTMRSLMKRLHDPHLGRRTVHITGSKGKGSTGAMIAGILRETGATTAFFSSPHLHDYTERIAIGEGPISREEFAAGLEAIRPQMEAERIESGNDVSTFGVLTALFFWLVRAQARAVEWQVVEVGLGGTFDTTNLFEEGDIAVITPISLEHTRILGDTRELIARDKAGIIKPGAVCILAPQDDPAVVEVVRARCTEVGAELVDVAATYDWQPLERHVYGQSFIVNGNSRSIEGRTQMLGEHQVANAATAIAVADAIGRRGKAISDRAIIEGLARSRLHGRMEVMGQRPLIVADGAHNEASAEVLAETLKRYFAWKRLFLIIGVMDDKDIRAMGFKLARMAELIVTTGFNSRRALDPFVALQEIGFLGTATVAEANISDAFDTALSHANEDDMICVTGSLYLVAEARQHLLGEGAIEA